MKIELVKRPNPSLSIGEEVKELYLSNFKKETVTVEVSNCMNNAYATVKVSDGDDVKEWSIEIECPNIKSYLDKISMLWDKYYIEDNIAEIIREWGLFINYKLKRDISYYNSNFVLVEPEDNVMSIADSYDDTNNLILLRDNQVVYHISYTRHDTPLCSKLYDFNTKVSKNVLGYVYAALGDFYSDSKVKHNMLVKLFQVIDLKIARNEI